jgi:DNA polymerase-3 subunit gamma/tau
VIEIDAASHGGVEDARDLRERAFYAPVQSRYKIYIIDEAHMVSREGFNALLKLVEEPPEYLRFIFATTEPEKVIATIRSRTHHYAFRLVAPRVLNDHLQRICEAEGVAVDDGVLPMVVRAGQGSVRDALSVLDQLVAGVEGSTITTAYASSLLGYTDAALLDDVIDAFASRRGDAVFEALDRALDAGLDPRRFVSDLLERFRDLLILAVSGADATEMQALVPRPPDERERMAEQTTRFGPAELTRNAELLAQGLTEMRGATAPRLTLELIAARMLLPSVDDTERQLQVRLEQLERQVRQGPPSAAPAAAPHRPAESADRGAPPPGVETSTAASPRSTITGDPVAPADAAMASGSDPASDTGSTSAPTATASASTPAAAAGDDREAAAPTEVSAAREGAAGRSPAAEIPPASAASMDSSVEGVSLDDIRRMWPQIVEAVMRRKRSAWIQLNRPGAGVLSLTGSRLALGLPDAGTVKGFTAGGYDAVLKLAILDVLNVDLDIDVIAQPASGGADGPAAASARSAPPSKSAGPDAPAPHRGEPASRASDDTAGDGSAPASATPRSGPTGAERIAAAKAQAPATPDDDESTIDLHSESTDDALTGEELLAQMLDAKQIGEIQH